MHKCVIDLCTFISFWH